MIARLTARCLAEIIMECPPKSQPLLVAMSCLQYLYFLCSYNNLQLRLPVPLRRQNVAAALGLLFQRLWNGAGQHDTHRQTIHASRVWRGVEPWRLDSDDRVDRSWRHDIAAPNRRLSTASMLDQMQRHPVTAVVCTYATWIQAWVTFINSLLHEFSSSIYSVSLSDDMIVTVIIFISIQMIQLQELYFMTASLQKWGGRRRPPLYPEFSAQCGGRRNKWGGPAYSGFHVIRTLDLPQIWGRSPSLDYIDW